MGKSKVKRKRVTLTREELVDLLRVMQYWLDNVEQEKTNEGEYVCTIELRDKLGAYVRRF